jgi:hypothetical protein
MSLSTEATDSFAMNECGAMEMVTRAFEDYPVRAPSARAI